MGVPVALTHALTRLVTAGSGTAYVLLDDSGTISYASPGAMRPLGFAEDDALGVHWSTFLRGDSDADLTASLEKLGLSESARGDGHLGEGIVALQTRGGRTRWIHVSVLDGRGDPDLNGLLVVGRGVTGQRLAAESALAVGDPPMAEAINRVADVFAQVLDFDRLLLSGIDNESLRILAMSGADAPLHLIGRSRPVHEQETDPLMRTGWDVVFDTADAEHGDWRGAAAGVGSYVSVLLQLAGQSVGALTWTSRKPHAFLASDGPMLAEAATATGVALLLLAQLERERETSTALLDRTAGLLKQAVTDPLTGLVNRTRLRDALAEALRAAALPGAAGGVGVLFCDLDRFKVVNDALGHHVGDTLLQQVASRLRRTVPAGCLVARLGGDEFVVLVPTGATNESLIEIGVALQQAVAEPIDVETHRLRVDLSAGAVVASADDTPDEVLQHADTAMYRAKAGGRHRVALWTEQVGAAALARFDLERELLLALSADAPPDARIRVAYQPVVDLRTGRLRGVEALARWTHPVLGAVPPSTFVALAEEVGLSAELTRVVSTQAIEAMARWSRRGRGGRLSLGLNISARDLADPAMLEGLRSLSETAGVAASQLMIELTETAIASASVESVQELGRLLDAGADLALDDFGTGYSSLVTLRELPVTTVKIDRSFVSGEGDGTDPTAGLADVGIVRAVIGMASSLGLEVVAEGVETAPQRDALLELSCQRGQGWLLGRPCDAAAIEAMLR